MSLKKRFLSLLLALAMTVSFSCTALAEKADGFQNFQPVRTYSETMFNDVSGWYEPYVSQMYRFGLMQGTLEKNGERSFSPHGAISIAETITLAARIHNIYHHNDRFFAESTPWHQSYADYALENGILSSEEEFGPLSAAATRAQFAVILSRALPENAFQPINRVELGAIPDVDMSQSYSFAVYHLYRAGVLTGGDLNRFQPGSTIKRSEAAAVAARTINPSLRVSFTLYAPLYVGFTPDRKNQGTVGITQLTMTMDGETCRLSMEFKSTESRFLALLNPSETAYLLNVVVIDAGVDRFTFTFPRKMLEDVYRSSEHPDSEKLVLEFYATGDPDSVTDRFYISIKQFAKYFDTARPTTGKA